MKDTKTFRYCENCNRAWVDVSPPTKAQYEIGLIKLDGSSTILLSDELAKIYKTHALYINGYFCDINCLHQHITNILRGEKIDHLKLEV